MIEREKYQEFLRKIKPLTALVIGDVMLDRYLYGNVSRLSPEAPVPILDFTHNEEKLGGAGNVALNFKKMGIEVDLMSYVGNDVEGESFLSLLKKQGMSSQYIFNEENRITTLKTRVLSGQQHLLRVDREKVKPLTSGEIEELCHKIEEAYTSKKYNIVILQDYNKGIFSEESIEAILSILLKKDSLICVDPKVENFWSYRNVDIIKPNLKELSTILGRNIAVKKKELSLAADYVESKLNNKISVFTLAENGIFLQDNVENLLQATQAKDIVDVCGAGDAVIVILSLAEAIGMPMDFTGELCNIAGSIVCDHIGVVPVSLEQFREKVH